MLRLPRCILAKFPVSHKRPPGDLSHRAVLVPDAHPDRDGLLRDPLPGELHLDDLEPHPRFSHVAVVLRAVLLRLADLTGDVLDPPVPPAAPALAGQQPGAGVGGGGAGGKRWPVRGAALEHAAAWLRLASLRCQSASMGFLIPFLRSHRMKWSQGAHSQNDRHSQHNRCSIT